MSAEKVVKINNNYEVERLMEEVERLSRMVSNYQEAFSYSGAEQILSLKNENKELKDNNLKLKAASAEKDKMIAYMDKNIDSIADVRADQKIQENNTEWQKKVNNAKSNGSKTVSAKNQQLIKENEKIQNMYNSLLGEFNDVNEKLDTQIELLNNQKVVLDTQTELLNNQKVVLDTQTELLYNIIDIVNNSSNIDEAKRDVDELITETKSALGIQYNDSRKPTKKEKIAFTELVDRLSENGMTNKEIARKLYSEGHPFMVTVSTESGREQKVGRYLHKKY